jgi:predicted 2-oxoglutarate/Fe(II)-dependent dioxygenase YbiX
MRPDDFTRRELFLVRDFLAPQERESLTAEVRAARGSPSKIVRKGAGYDAEVDESYRRTWQAQVSGATTESMHAKLLALKPTLETHFRLPLAGCERPQFFIYREGDFFAPHRDVSEESEPTAYAHLKRRRVALVLFLNGEDAATRANTYDGGRLRFYEPATRGTVEERNTEVRYRMACELKGEAGLLLAFRPSLTHEVTRVERGERYTVVSWFF